jgi:hypothetical protein
LIGSEFYQKIYGLSREKWENTNRILEERNEDFTQLWLKCNEINKEVIWLMELNCFLIRENIKG